MFARIQTMRLSDAPGSPNSVPREFCDVLRMHPAYAGAYFLTDIVAATRALVTLWGTRPDAERASDRTRERSGERPFPLLSDRILEVVDDRPGPAADVDPGAAGIAEYDGPMSDDRRAATEEATTGWVAQAWATAPGAVRLVTMWDPEARATRVLNVATTADAAEETGRAIMAAEAAADPDRATAPDRVAIHRVDHADVPDRESAAPGARG